MSRLPSADKRTTVMDVKLRLTVLLSAMAIAGFAAASFLTGSALAWSPDNLPPGVSVEIHGVGACTNPSADYYKLEQTQNGTVVAISDRFCTDSPTYQQDFDAWVNAHYTPPPTTTAAATTTPTTSTGASTTPTPTPTPNPAPAPATTTTVVATTTVATTTGPPPPVASFTSSEVGLSLTFTDTSTVAAPATVATVTWHYGDGANGTGSPASHAFTTAGTFTVVEIVTDSNGLASQASEQIAVSPFGGHSAFSETMSPRLSTVASKVYGAQLAVYCVRSWGTAKPEYGYGLSIIGSRQANIWQTGCAALTTGKGPVALALLVLGHEVAHSLGILGERSSDCYSLKRVPTLAKVAGVFAGKAAMQDAALVKKRYGAAC